MQMLEVNIIRMYVRRLSSFVIFTPPVVITSYLNLSAIYRVGYKDSLKVKLTSCFLFIRNDSASLIAINSSTRFKIDPLFFTTFRMIHVHAYFQLNN